MQYFLDKSGLERVWEHIKTYIGKKIYSPDDTLTLSQENVLGVRLPTRGATKAEFDNMSDQQKQGFVVVTDENVTKPNSGGSSSGEVYSAEEVRIGTWINGKPIYREVISTTTPNRIGNAGIVATINNIDVVVNLYGFIEWDNRQVLKVPEWRTSMDVANDDITFYITTGNTFLINKPLTVFIEYTKTID